MKISIKERLKKRLNTAIDEQIKFLIKILNSPNINLSINAKRDIEILNNIKQQIANNYLDIPTIDMPSFYLCIYNDMEENGYNAEIDNILKRIEKEFKKATKFDIKIASGILIS